MGESGSRRSTLVSRLPIFRRSSSKRQESLPSSPSSGGVGNGVHTSSPSSTNSSSGSTGKRRSLFRTPSLSFSKRNSDPRVQSVNLNLTPPPPPPPQTQDTDANGNNHETFSDNGGRTKSRHSFGFGSHKQKKISRSQTEDFNNKASSSSSSSANRNVFINCISGSGVNEGDDSGFLDDYSGASNNNKRSSRHKKQLLPKSFSAQHRFSRTSDHPRPPEVSQHSPTSTAITPHTAGLAPGSWPGELVGTGAESSLQSPMISEDLTTAITPSEFIPITEDSLSEADALPAPSPGCGLAQGSSPTPGTGPGTFPSSPSAAPEPFSVVVSTSQVFFTPVQSSTDKPLLPDTSTNTDYDTAVSISEPEPGVSSLPHGQLLLEEMKERDEEEEDVRKEEPVEKRKPVVQSRRTTVSHTDHSTSESEGCVPHSEGWYPNHEQMERRARTTLSVQERGNYCGCHDPRSSHLSRQYTASLCSSVSPYHEVIRLERRLRSSSEGAGGPRIHGNHREASSVDGCGLLKHRNNSSSSKLGSLDVLNNLGSSELDEDDLMLDLDLSDDHRHRHVSREDSSQSLASCINFLHSSMDSSAERGAVRENHHREVWPPSVLMPTDCSSALGSLGPGRDDDLLLTGLETLPFRMMQQDCTAVKTLLLRLRRTLQESRETSPASSLQSLPISPCSEKSLPFKESIREDFLLQQLKERDAMILRLQKDLESAKAALRTRDGQTTDRTTQTEHTGSEISPPGRGSGPGLSSSSSSLAPRDRRVTRGAGATVGGDPSNLALHHHHHPPLHARLDRFPDRFPPKGASVTSSARCSTVATPLASSTNQSASDQHQGFHGDLGPNQSGLDSPSSKHPEGGSSSSSESLTVIGGGGGGARRGGDHAPLSHIPRAVSTSVSSSRHSLTSRGSSASSGQASPPPSNSSSSSSSSLFSGRLGQPPRGPLSLHSYSRKNVFLQHSLHTSELTALTQRDG